jgi:hypothetical protein
VGEDTDRELSGGEAEYLIACHKFLEVLIFLAEGVLSIFLELRPKLTGKLYILSWCNENEKEVDNKEFFL